MFRSTNNMQWMHWICPWGVKPSVKVCFIGFLMNIGWCVKYSHVALPVQFCQKVLYDIVEYKSLIPCTFNWLPIIILDHSISIKALWKTLVSYIPSLVQALIDDVIDCVCLRIPPQALISLLACLSRRLTKCCNSFVMVIRSDVIFILSQCMSVYYF